LRSGIFHGSEIYSFNLLQNVHVLISFYRNRSCYFLICKQKFWFQKRKHSQLSLKCSRVRIEMNYEKFKRSDRPDSFHSLTLLSTITIKRILSTCNVCGLVSSTVRKFIHSICCKMYMYEFHFTEIGNLFVSILR
jgi:hypothetical protein